MTAAIDEFARSLFDEAKAHLEAAQDASDEAQSAYLHASLLLGFCAIEAHLSSIVEDFHSRSDLELLERSILLERKVRLVDGEFRLTDEFQMFRLEDRIEFVFARFSTQPLDRNAGFWGEFGMAIKLRNELTHPKTKPHVTIAAVGRALRAILDLLNAMHKGVYGGAYPGYNLRLKTATVLTA